MQYHQSLVMMFGLIVLIMMMMISGTYTNVASSNNNNRRNEFNGNEVLRDGGIMTDRNSENKINKIDQRNYHQQYRSSDEDENYNDNNNNNNNHYSDDSKLTTTNLSLEDQVKLLSKQMTALMNRRREDYKLLENNLKNSVRKNAQQFGDMDLRNELNQLRQEIKQLHKESVSTAKERLTVDWFSATISELRAEMSELQEASVNTSRNLQQRLIIFEDVAELKNDFHRFNLELEALKIRQETTEKIVKELRAEAIQSSEDFRKRTINRHGDRMKTTTTLNNGEGGKDAKTQHHSQHHHHHHHHHHDDNIDDESQQHQLVDHQQLPSTIDYIEPEADHRMRHRRFLRQQLHDIDVTQKQMKRQINELQHHRIDDRLHGLEMEQRRLANVNFNMSRQLASLDRLHGSMLELLEDIESIQNKVDKNIPDIKREISKVEFNSAQLSAEQSLLREEGHNAQKSIQAIAVSVSTLQDERDIEKQMRKDMSKLQDQVEKLMVASTAHKDILHQRIEKIELDSAAAETALISSNITLQAQTIAELQVAAQLVNQLETVELQYESIVNKLPKDCSQVERKSNGLYLIAPTGQQRPVMTYCNQHWTTIQRRYDGSVDFNRSWEEYARGFGSPAGEYWIGNDVLTHLTVDNCTSLKIIMQDIYDNTWEALYSDFYVGQRSDGYRLSISGYTGNASDALDYQNHMEFSAIDVDRDISNTHCAGNYEGGWWFSHCQHANLNGRYNLGLTWFDASRNEWIAVKSSHMMVSRRMDCTVPYTAEPTVEILDSSTPITTTTTMAMPITLLSSSSSLTSTIKSNDDKESSKSSSSSSNSGSSSSSSSSSNSNSNSYNSISNNKHEEHQPQQQQQQITNNSQNSKIRIISN